MSDSIDPEATANTMTGPVLQQGRSAHQRRLRRQATAGAVLLVVLVTGIVLAVVMTGSVDDRAEIERATTTVAEVSAEQKQAMATWQAYWEGRGEATYEEMSVVARAEVLPRLEHAKGLVSGEHSPIAEVDRLWTLAQHCVTRSIAAIERNVRFDDALSPEQNAAEQAQAWTDRGTFCGDMRNGLTDLEESLERRGD